MLCLAQGWVDIERNSLEKKFRNSIEIPPIGFFDIR
jgi:hypothetical protein